MDKTYVEYICDLIKRYEPAEPIYSSMLAQRVAERYTLPIKKAALATAVALKRILAGKLVPDLRFYKKGVYFRTKVTLFGELGINKEALIADKYLINDKGYESGLALLHKWGLTTQIPNEKVIVTNGASRGTRKDKALGIVTKPPKVPVSSYNKRYLQVLDALDILSKAPVDADKPYLLMAQLIDKLGLSYGVLLAFAGRYYNDNTLKQLSKTAMAKGMLA